MSIDFSKFDQAINKEEVSKAIEEAKNNTSQGESLETPAGDYVAKIEKMEVGPTKDGRPMFKVMLRVIEAGENASAEVTEYLSHFKNKKPCLFMNRVIGGITTTYKADGSIKWSNEKAIGVVTAWLQKLEPSVPVEFKNYSQFDDLVLDIYEELADAVELAVKYDDKAFNSISIEEVFDAE